MKAKEELNALKNEVEVLNQKLSTLTEEELEQVSGGLKKLCDGSDCENCHYTTCPQRGH